MSGKKIPSERPYGDSSAELEKMACGSDEDQELLALKRLIQHMPDRKAPAGLTESILSSLEPKTVPGWLRLYRWVLKPRTVTFHPLKLVPTIIVLVLGLFTALYFAPWRQNSGSLDSHQRDLITVTFTLNYPNAQSVSLIGSFNQWNPVGYKMRRRGEQNSWILELRLPEGRHEYAFLVDGKIVVPDQSSPFYQSDGFGNRNSVLFISRDEPTNI
jgi:hypothetical protein